MPNRATALTAAAGEHFVAYKLSAMGYPVALTRGGSPTIDLMVGDLSGEATVSIQVKTSNWAKREYKRKPKNNHWEWDVGRKALDLCGDSIFYAFVDLRWNDDNPDKSQSPEVFIVPSKTVADFLGPDWSRYMFWIMEEDKQKYHESWHLITTRLNR
jgi:hypothetical protein